MKIIVLVENLKNNANNLLNEHGLSLLLQIKQQNILFDTGRTCNFIHNAKEIGISIEQIDMVIISHGHYDHGGGLINFLKKNTKAQVYMKKEAVKEQYFYAMKLKKKIGLDKQLFKKYSNRIVFIDSYTEIYQGVHILTKIDEYYEKPSGNKFLYTMEQGQIVKDQFAHELLLVIEEEDGMCVFTGCAHRGAANMIKTVNNAFPNKTIKAVIGGFHLITIPFVNFINSSQKSIDIIANIILENDIKKVYTGHCTGTKSFKKLKVILGERIKYLNLGSEIDI